MSEPEVALRYAVRPRRDAWVLPEGSVPESTTHDEAVARIKSLIEARFERAGKNARVVRNLAIRFFEDDPRLGIDPDVCVLDPPPGGHLRSIRTWEPTSAPPTVCFEVVSESHPYKDYVDIQDRYAAMGAAELVVFDPVLAGPNALGGPAPLQLWRRDAEGVLARVHFGSGPVFSEELDTSIHASGVTIDISDDREGRERWLTREESERAGRLDEQARRVDAERRLADLEERIRRS